MRLRKRALVLGKFRFIVASGDECGKELESSLLFQAAVKNTQRSSGINFVSRPPGYKGRLATHTESRYADLNFYKTPKIRFKMKRLKKGKRYSGDESTGSSDLSNNNEFESFPGCGKRHHAAWSTPLGDIRIDAMVKIYDMLSIQTHHAECDNRGPMSRWFGLVDPRLTDTADGRVHFDANMFWTVGLFFKHFGTSGIESWDTEMAEMARTHIYAEELNRRNGQVAVFNARYQGYSTKTQDEIKSESQGNNLDTFLNIESKQDYRYTGCVVEWHGSYGKISCMKLPSTVLLLETEVESISGNWQQGDEIPIGTSVNFGLFNDKVSGFKAMNARLYI